MPPVYTEPHPLEYALGATVAPLLRHAATEAEIAEIVSRLLASHRARCLAGVSFDAPNANPEGYPFLKIKVRE